MYRHLLTLIGIFFSTLLASQTLRIGGNVNDTVARQPLPNVLMMAVRFSDSTLVSYTRSDARGQFKRLALPLDTYIVILAHPNFSDKTYFLLASPKDTVFTIMNAVLPPKSTVLNEVEVLAYREKTYYKGDTLVFTADSFKTRPNANVEDLLRKLPGVRVDAKGKISVQGKEVDQVLVDGDEFFGSDPTVATRNLNASSVENVQIYDKKNESTEEGKSETLKIVNLKLKDDAKKGYFGKVSGASDFTKFYENEALFNKFKGNRKVSVFGLAANTPKQAFDWGDIDRYGLSGEQQWQYNEDNDMWYSNREEKTGVPQTIKSGFYFADKFGKNTKLNMDYTFNQNSLQVGKETNTQFFLQDTSYTNASVNAASSAMQSHAFNVKLVQKLDSLTEMTLQPKTRYSTGNNSSTQTDDFFSQVGQNTRRTTVLNSSKTENSSLDVLLKLKRNFMKKDRLLTFIYQPTYNNTFNSTTIQSDLLYFLNQENNRVQKIRRRQNTYKMDHSASVAYVEPFSKKLKTELSYNYNGDRGNSSRSSFDYSTGSDVFDSSLSNNFENKRTTNKAGMKLIYEVKKYRFSVGTFARNVLQENTNLSTGQPLSLSVNNVLPMAAFNYRRSQGSNLSVNYSSSSQLPDVRQMQPVVDNSDPNRISLGNPNLKPSFTNNLHLNYYFYKGISDVNFYGGLTLNNTNNQLSNTTTFDEQGRAITQPVNVNGSYYGNFYMGGGFPVLKRFLKIYYNLNGGHNNNVSLINGATNTAKSSNVNGSLTFEKQEENYEAGVSGEYHYNVPATNFNASSNQPFYTYQLSGNVLMRFPKKFKLTVDGQYTNNGNRFPGYNLNYFILNASFGKTFLKNENLIVSFDANDILNQNINNQRFINANQIVDSKTTIIRRYFLLRAIYKLNSQKTKEDEDD